MEGGLGNEFQQKTITGIGWSVTSKLLNQGLNFILGVILARLLSPQDFGLIGMVMVFVGFANLYLDLGFGSALIHKQDTTSDHYSSIFWINLGAGFALMLVFMALSPFIASFYKEPSIIPLTILISTNYFIGSFKIVQISILTKKLAFRRLTMVEITALILSGITAVGMALGGLGVWSLALQSVTSTLITVLLIWFMSDWRPEIRINWSAVKELLGFSTNLLGFSSVNYWVRNADNMLVGRFLGTSALGIYSRSYSLMLLPLHMISNTVGRVMFPALSTIQNDRPRVAKVYLRITRAIAFITFPLMIGLWVVVDHFVITLYGSQWIEMIPILKIFCFVGMIQSISTLNGNLYLSQGRSDLQFRVGLILGVLAIGSIVLGLRWGIQGVAISFGAYSILSAVPGMTIAVSLVGLTVVDVLKYLRDVFVIAVSMGIGVEALELLLPADLPHWSYLVVQASSGIIIYFALMFVFKPQVYLDINQIVHEQFRNLQLFQFRLGRAK